MLLIGFLPPIVVLLFEVAGVDEQNGQLKEEWLRSHDDLKGVVWHEPNLWPSLLVLIAGSIAGFLVGAWRVRLVPARP